MKSHDLGWNGHTWHETNPRQLRLGTGASVLQRHCTDCGRDFLIDVDSGTTHAVFASAISFYKLDDEVTERWVREPCLGTRLPADAEDRRRKTVELFVYETVPVFGNSSSASASAAALRANISASK